jgi:glycosyltransferase involved in cell wall biosynthesis
MGTQRKIKETYHYSDRIVLSTFGLIENKKNIETTLFALPEIVKKHPSLIYLIIGKTHPEVIKTKGKNTVKLATIVTDLYLEDNVVFINEYVELKQLLEYLTLSDIYLFSSKDPNQAVSGTLLTP